MPTLESWVPPVALLAEAFLLVLIGRIIAQFLTRRNFKQELTSKDNPAAGLGIGGYHLGLFIALGGLIVGGEPADGGGMWDGLGRDAVLVGLHGLVAIVCLLISAALWRPVLGVDFRRDLFEGRNIAAGLVAGAGLVATGLVYNGAVQGEGRFGIAFAFFGLGQGALFLTSLLYEWITPYDIDDEIAVKQNVAAAIGFAGALVATGIIVGHAASGDFAGWRESTRDFFLHLLPLIALPAIRWIVVNGILLGFRNVNPEISQDRNTAAGTLEAVAYVGTAVFVTHLL